MGNRWSIRIISLIIVLAAWEAAGRGGIRYLAPPSLIVETGYNIIVSAKTIEYLSDLLQFIFYGYGLAVLLGISIGLLTGHFRKVEYSLDPFLTALYSVPPITWLPLLLIAMGIGNLPIIVIVFLFCFFSIWINTMEGVKNTDRKLVEAAKSFGTSGRQLFFKVYLPSSIPYIFAGLRLGIGESVKAALVAEMYIITGFGLLLTRASNNYDTATSFVVMAIIIVIGVLSTELIKFFGRKVAPWIENM